MSQAHRGHVPVVQGLVKAGAFDNLNKNRKSLFESIPNFIIKTRYYEARFWPTKLNTKYLLRQEVF